KILQFAGTFAVCIRKILFRVNGILLLHDFIEFLMPHHHGFNYRKLIKLIVVLVQYGHTLAGSKTHRTRRWVYLARQDFQECRLSGTVGTDNAITIAM